MHIDRSQYTQVHLDELQSGYGVEDWFSFLDKPHRIIYVLRNSHPPHVNNDDVISGKKATWDMPLNVLCSNFYGLFPNPTNAEIFVSELLFAMITKWNKDGCIFDPKKPEAIKLLAFYDFICTYDDEKKLQIDALSILPTSTIPITPIDLCFWMENLVKETNNKD